MIELVFLMDNKFVPFLAFRIDEGSNTFKTILKTYQRIFGSNL